MSLFSTSILKRKEELFKVLSFLPIFLLIITGCWFTVQWQNLSNLADRAERSKGKIRSHFIKKEQIDFLKKKIARCDAEFIENQLDGLTFLQREKEQLLPLVDLFPQDVQLQGRIDFLKKNHLKFTKESERCFKKIVEKQWEQTTPIEIDTDDLSILLTRFSLPEDPIAPQIFLNHFTLTRELSSLGNPHYKFTCGLIERTSDDP